MHWNWGLLGSWNLEGKDNNNKSAAMWWWMHFRIGNLMAHYIHTHFSSMLLLNYILHLDLMQKASRFTRKKEIFVSVLYQISFAVWWCFETRETNAVFCLQVFCWWNTWNQKASIINVADEGKKEKCSKRQSELWLKHESKVIRERMLHFKFASLSFNLIASTRHEKREEFLMRWCLSRDFNNMIQLMINRLHK